MRHHLGYSSTTALLTECLRYCMFHVPVFLQFFTKTCEGCFSSWLPFKSNLPFFFFFLIVWIPQSLLCLKAGHFIFYIWCLKCESEQKAFIPRDKGHERYLLLPGSCEPAPTSFSQDRTKSILLVWEEAIQTKQLHSTCRKHLIASILRLRAAAPAEFLLAFWMQTCSSPTEGENRSKFTLKWVVWYATLFCFNLLLDHANRKLLHWTDSGSESVFSLMHIR